MPNPDAPEQRQPAVTRRRALVAFLAAVVLVLAVVLVVRLTGEDDPGTTASDDTTPSVGASSSATTVAPSVGVTPSATPSADGAQPTDGAGASPGATVPTPGEQPSTEAALGDEGDLGNGVTVDVVRIRAVEGTAQGVGEIAAPAVRFTVRVRNDGARRVSLENSVVNVSYGRNSTPAAQLSGPGARAMPAAVAAGDRVSGVYVFSVPESSRGRVQVSYSYATTAPTVVFSGRAS